MATVQVETMEDLLTCPLCLDSFTEPKTLKCLHSYCLECLKKMTKNVKEVPIACPLCREETMTPSEGVEGLPTNFFIKNMMDVVELRSRNENTQCTNCQEGLKASCRCMDCEEFFCEQCLKAHERLRRYHDHRIVDLKKLLSPNSSKEFHPPMKCKRHEEVCKFYCQTCNVLVCRDCTVIDHVQPKHTVGDLKDIVGRYRDRLSEAMEKARKHTTKIEKIQAVTQDRKDKRKESLDKIPVRLKQRKNYIIQQICQALNDQESQILSELEQFRSIKLNDDEEEQKWLGSDLKRTGNYVLFMKNLLESGNDDEMMNMYEHLVRCLDDPGGRNPFWYEMNDLADTGAGVEFSNVANDEEVQNLTDQMKRCLGKLSIPKALASPYELVEQREKVYDIGKEIVVLINPTGISPAQRSSGPDDLSSFQAKVLTPNQTVIPANLEQHADGSLSVHFTSYIKGRHRLAVRLSGNELRGSPMTVDIGGDLDYSPDTSLLQKLPLDEWKNTRKTFAVTADFYGNIYILSEDKVYVYDAQFNLTHWFGEGGRGPGQLETPMAIAADRDGRVLVTDAGKHQLIVFDRSGDFIQEIGDKGEKHGQLCYPLGIAADRYGNVAVCDAGNHRVQIFNPDGTFKFSFGDEEKSQLFPVAIAFNSHGHMVVSESSLWSQNRLHSSGQTTFDAKTAVECVKIFDSTGQAIMTFGESGEGKGRFWGPIRVTVDSQDHIWVAEFSYGRIQVFDQEGNVIEVYSSGEEEKGTGWLPILTRAANGSILYYRSYFDTS